MRAAKKLLLRRRTSIVVEKNHVKIPGVQFE